MAEDDGAIDRWKALDEVLNLKRLSISCDFDPDKCLLDDFVTRGDRTTTLKDVECKEIVVSNLGYRFKQFAVPIDATFGEVARCIDIILQANEDMRCSFLEDISLVGVDPVSGSVYFNVYIGS